MTNAAEQTRHKAASVPQMRKSGSAAELDELAAAHEWQALEGRPGKLQVPSCQQIVPVIQDGRRTQTAHKATPSVPAQDRLLSLTATDDAENAAARSEGSMALQVTFRPSAEQSAMGQP